jgi:hypothetical protein
MMNTLVEVIKRRWIKLGYEIKYEIHKYDGHTFNMRRAYSPTGLYIGEAKDANFLAKKKGIRLFGSTSGHVANFGFNPERQVWYGWSHRAIVGFKIGDRIFEENFGNDHTPFTKHGKVIIKSLEDAKQAAKNFAKYIG